MRNQYDDNFGIYFIKLGQFFGHPAILLALGLSVIGLVALYLLIWRRRDRNGTTAWERARAADDGMVRAFASLGADWRVWIALAAFLTPYTLLFTAFFGHPTGIISGTTGSLLYWLAQHGVQRGGQPSYYYLIQLVVYEPLALLWGIVGLIMTGVLLGQRLRRPNTAGAAIDWGFAMPLLLTWWALATLALYSWAGEKMPWLTVHVALPIVLLGAWALARVAWLVGRRHRRTGHVAPTPDAALELADVTNGNGHAPAALAAPRPKIWDGGLLIYLSIFGTVAALFFLLISIVAKSTSGQQDATPYIFPLALVLVGLLTVFAGLLRGPRWAIGALALGVTLALSLYGSRAAYQLSYRYGDDARELLIFVQTSPDVPRIVRKLEQANTRRNGSMKVWYDNETIWSVVHAPLPGGHAAATRAAGARRRCDGGAAAAREYRRQRPESASLAGLSHPALPAALVEPRVRALPPAAGLDERAGDRRLAAADAAAAHAARRANIRAVLAILDLSPAPRAARLNRLCAGHPAGAGE